MPKLSKRKLRDTMRELNDKLNSSDVAARSQAMQERLLDSKLWNEADIVALYMPLSDEPDTKLLFAEAVSSGKLPIFPRCFTDQDQGGPSFSGGLMELVPCTCQESFTVGKFGILEPDNTCQALCPGVEPFLPEIKKTLILVPGRAFDKQGGRLGRGGGYYDRWLSLPGLRGSFFMGYGFSCSVVDKIPHEKHDIKLHGLCTDQELLCF